MPPKGEAVTDRRSPWAPENEAKAFGALQATLGLKRSAPADGEKVRPSVPPAL